MWGVDDGIIKSTKWPEEKVIMAIKSYIKRKWTDKNLWLDFNDFEKTKTLSDALKENWISWFEFSDRTTSGWFVKAHAILPWEIKTSKQLNQKQPSH